MRDVAKLSSKIRPLGEVVTLNYGKALARSERDPNGSIPVYGANGVMDWSDHTLTEGPSLIIGRKGSAGEITRVDGPFWPSDVTYYTTHDHNALNFDFLHYTLQTLNLPSMARGVKPGINRNEVYALPIPLPPLDEQQRIVAVLDKAFEGLVRARARAEANLQNARELFERSAEITFEESAANDNPQTFLVEELALPEKGSIRTGPFGSQLKHSEFVDEGISVLGIDNAVQNEFRWGKARFISEEKYEGLRRYTVKPRDVIITIMGTCGRCAIIPDDIPVAVNTKHLCCISLDQSKCLPEFLHRYFLHSPQGREYLSAQASGSVMDGLNMGIIKAMPVDVPPLEKQQSIADKLAEIDEHTRQLAEYYKSKVQDLGHLRQSLLQKAFAGELT